MYPVKLKSFLFLAIAFICLQMSLISLPANASTNSGVKHSIVQATPQKRTLTKQEQLTKFILADNKVEALKLINQGVRIVKYSAFLAHTVKEKNWKEHGYY